MKRFEKVERIDTFHTVDRETDPAWDGIRSLLREANRPGPPDPDRLRTLRRQALQRYELERRTVWGGLRERIAYWADLVSGRSAAARLVHLAAAGAVGAGVALALFQGAIPDRVHPEASSSRPVMMASLPSGTSAESPAGPAAVASLPGDIPGSHGPERLATPVESPSVKIEKSAANVADSAQIAERERMIAAVSPTGSPRERLEKAAAGERVAAASPGTAPSGLAETQETAVTQAVSIASMPQENQSGSAPSYEHSMLEEIEKLRFKLNLSGDKRYLADVDRLQLTVIEALKDRQDNAAESEQMRARRLFRDAELAMQEQRYVEAITAYNRVVDEFQGGYWAYMAQLLIANIEFEYLNEFGSALDQYRKCLETYPTHYFSEDNLNLIKQRIEFLTQNSENNWHALRLYRDAQKSGPAVARHHLMDLLELYPESKLAGPAAQALANLAAADLEGRYVDPDRVIQVLQRALDLNPKSSQAAAIQYSIADIFKRRLFKPNLATPAFQQVLRMNPSPELAAAANSQLQELNYLRSATPAP